MKEAKQKARELINMFIDRTRNKGEKSMSFERAKSCAVVCCYECRNASLKHTLLVPREVFEWQMKQKTYWDMVEKYLNEFKVEDL